MKSLQKFNKAVQEIRKYDSEMQTQTLQIFLTIAMKDGQSISEIGKATGLSTPSASRNVSLLGERHRSGRAGLRLVERRKADDGRVKAVFLTAKGHNVVKALNEIIEGS